MMRIEYFENDKTITLNNVEKKLSAYNLNTVLSIIAHFICNTKADEYGYHPIHSQKFKKIYSGYHIYLKYLISNSYIERNRYIVNEKPFGYRFSELLKQNIELTRIISNNNHNKRLKPTDDNSTYYISDWVKDRIKKDFLSVNILFDLSKNQLPKTTDDWGRFIDIKKWLYNNFKLHKWSEKKRFFHWKNHRLYTNFTQLSSHIRLNNILLNKEELVEFDIRSSFPLMLAKYCIIVNPEIKNDYDFKEYCTDVLNGKFYGRLTQKLNATRNCHKKGLESDWDTRLLNKNDTKLLFQIYLNGDHKRVPYIKQDQTDIKTIMQFNYSELHSVVDNMKGSLIKVYDELVKLETGLIFKVVEELYLKFDDIRILSCHDAIYVPKSYEEKVRVIWESILKSFTEELPYEKDSEDTSKNMQDILYELNYSLNWEVTQDLCVMENKDDDYWGTPPYMIKQRDRLAKRRARYISFLQ